MELIEEMTLEGFAEFLNSRREVSDSLIDTSISYDGVMIGTLEKLLKLFKQRRQLCISTKELSDKRVQALIEEKKNYDAR